MPTDPTPPFAKLKPKSAAEIQTVVAFAELLTACDHPAAEWEGGPVTGRNLRQWFHAMKNGNEGGATAAKDLAKYELRTHLHGREVSRVIDLCDEYIYSLNNPLSAQVQALVAKLAEAGFDVTPHAADKSIV